MFFLIAPLLLIGFFSPANSETVDSESQKSNEHLISLRDYDFVGEDQRLSALLAERMAMLHAPLNLSDLEAGGPGPEPAGPWPRDPGPFQPKPDYLHSNVRLPQQANVSMDYAEFLNRSDWHLEVNPSLLALIPKPGGAPAPHSGGPPAPGHGRPPAPGPGGPPALGPGGPPASGYRRAPAFETGWAPDPGLSRDGRRQRYKDQTFQEHNDKILDIMKQCIYNAQRKMILLDPLVRRYERDPRYRIAFIFNRLEEWKHDMRTVLFSTMKYRWYPRRVKRCIWYYEHMLRLNIDITYSVQHLINLHTAYQKNMEALAPLGDSFQLEKMRKEQRKLKKMEALGISTFPPGMLAPGVGRS